MKMDLFTISDEYVAYLMMRNPRVMSNKPCGRRYKRKYLGLVTRLGGFSYFVPLSSPKQKDYVPGTDKIRKDSIATIYIRQNKKLFETIRFNSMIPVPESELASYRINDEGDLKYKIVVLHEFMFIRQNSARIEKTARNLYDKKIAALAGSGDQNPLLNLTLDFPSLEQACLAWK